MRKIAFLLLPLLFAPTAVAQELNPINSCAGCDEMTSIGSELSGSTEFWRSFTTGTEMVARVDFRIVLGAFSNECGGSGSCPKMRCHVDWTLKVQKDHGTGPNRGYGGLIVKWGERFSATDPWSNMNLPTRTVDQFKEAPAWTVEKNPKTADSGGQWRTSTRCGTSGYQEIRADGSGPSGTTTVQAAAVVKLQCSSCVDPQ